MAAPVSTEDLPGSVPAAAGAGSRQRAAMPRPESAVPVSASTDSHESVYGADDLDIPDFLK